MSKTQRELKLEDKLREAVPFLTKIHIGFEVISVLKHRKAIITEITHNPARSCTEVTLEASEGEEPNKRVISLLLLSQLYKPFEVEQEEPNYLQGTTSHEVNTTV